ncbi:MAG TPA: 16S rRNA (guanine(527)-N(7))-methyltransferase RsmG, partial [Candidatus Nitrosotenuis sp.]|nr:16S rRNA (guanine(527)-N(7))-methyltransferase RsmG [Candidatus Nitrosotenuis sp.]
MIYLELLFNWNRKINLTAVKTPVQAITRHFGESIFAATLLPMNRGVLVDVGSGAGFPGLALKLACPQLEVNLLEPSLKKCAFLAEVTRTLQLEGVQILSERSERAFREEEIA